ncbi:MAG: sugar phosphate isomerase/epimerase family protein [Armatimonadota bacterium]
MSFSAIIHAMTYDGLDAMSLPAALQVLREAGFDGVMLMSIPGRPALTAQETPEACLLDLARSDLDVATSIADEAGMRIVGLYGAGIDPTSEAAFDESVAHLRDACRAAEGLGCRHVGHSGGRAEAAGMTPDEKLEQIRRLARIVDAAAAEFGDMLFAVDAHYHGVIESVADCEHYLRELSSERAGILLNTGHMTTCEQPGWELLERHPARVPVIGWKDHRPDPAGERPFLSVQLGTGDAPLQRYVAAARGQHADRVHVINVEHVPMDRKRDALHHSLQHLQLLWERAR